MTEESRSLKAQGTDGATCLSPFAGAYCRDVDTVTREIAGETLVVPIRGHLADVRRVFSLNPVGAFVWSRLDGTHDVEGLCAAVAEAFDVEPEQAEPSVRAFLAQLEEAELTASAASPKNAVPAGGGEAVDL